MNNWGKQKVDPTSKITPSAWRSHFENLLNDKNMIQKDNGEYSRGTFDPLLDGHITKLELKDAINRLKKGKSPGPDCVLAEYLKSFRSVAEPTLLRIINIIFSNQIYPSAWTRSFLKPIYKKDDVKDPDNYRGLAIGSIFGKRFSFILLNRLNKYIKANNLISPNQIGFMKECRTADHIFLLQTIIEKVVRKNNQKLFAVFIDFKKAYDTVNRENLFNRLSALGINGFMFRNNEKCIKEQNTL